MLLELQTQHIIGFDTEFSDFDYTTNDLLVVQIGTENNQYVFTWYDLEECQKQYIFDLLKNESILKIGHNIKVDLNQFCYKYGIVTKNVYDTMVGHLMLFKGADKKASLKHILKEYLGVEIEKETQKSFINKRNPISLTAIEIEYCKNDVKYLIPIYKKQQIGIKLYNMEYLANKIEMPLIPALSPIECRGINFDEVAWLEQAQTNKQYLKECEDNLRKKLKAIYDKFPHIGDIEYIKNKPFTDFLSDFSVNSPIQLTKMFITTIGIKNTNDATLNTWLIQNKTQLKHTEKETIRLLFFDFIETLLHYRESNKANSTYGVNFLKYVKQENNCSIIRTSYKTLFTTTGRLSSGDVKYLTTDKSGKDVEKKANLFVNFQNIPAKNMYRKCFIASKGMLFGTIDLSACEIRILASRSQDPLLIAAVMEDKDMHSLLATESFRIIKKDPKFIVSEHENKHLRTLHKKVLFALFYGAQYQRISEILNVSTTDAKLVYNKIKDILRPCFVWLENYCNEALKKKYALINFVSNRRIWLGDYSKYNKLNLEYPKFAGLKRELYNAPMQGTNADIMKEIIVNVNSIEGVQILGSVHDELKLQTYKESLIYEVNDLMINTANKYLTNPVTMKTSVHISNTWIK